MGNGVVMMNMKNHATGALECVMSYVSWVHWIFRILQHQTSLSKPRTGECDPNFKAATIIFLLINLFIFWIS